MTLLNQLPVEFVEHLNSVLGYSLRVISSLRAREGACYKVEGDGEEMLLKFVDSAADNPALTRRACTLRREAELLKAYGETAGDLYIASGEIDTTSWLLRRWISGVTASQYCSYVRAAHPQEPQPEQKRRFIRDLCQMLRQVIRLDEAGYLHGDLQPNHFLVGHDGKFHLIDLELAVRKDDAEAEYGGALVHFVSPETARRMLVRDQHIPLDALSEIYSFGAVAFFLYTGKTACVYNDVSEGKQPGEPSFEQRLKAISHGRLRPFAQAGAGPFPDLERVLSWFLSPNIDQRCPTFDTALTALEEIRCSRS
jgi:serine/threonine protein kinase